MSTPDAFILIEPSLLSPPVITIGFVALEPVLSLTSNLLLAASTSIVKPTPLSEFPNLIPEATGFVSLVSVSLSFLSSNFLPVVFL